MLKFNDVSINQNIHIIAIVNLLLAHYTSQ